ncbi:transposase domain-containing protein, partial [Lysinibacillus macroides]
WLFSQSMRGATASAIIYSIVETAKENRLNPMSYLNYLFEQLPQIDLDDQEALDQFLPWSKTIPKECRIPDKVK